MKIKSYKPLDEDCYQMEEYIFDTTTGKKEFTGKRYRKVGNYIPQGSDDYKAFVQELIAKGRVVLYNPKNFTPYAYELIMDK